MRSLLTLPEFFEGNDDFGSIGCNLYPPPCPQAFFDVLTEIASRADVDDVRVQICDTYRCLLGGMTDGVFFEAAQVPEGMQAVACSWD